MSELANDSGSLDGSADDLYRGRAFVRQAADVTLDGTTDVYAHIEQLAVERALRPDIMRSKEIFPWIAESSSNVVDFYGTRMTPQTLQNYLANLKDGVGFMQSHSIRDFVGASVDGWLVDEEFENRTQQLIGGFYSVRDLKLGAINTSDFIDAMAVGIIRDVSIGFFADDIRCTICGGQIMDFWAYIFDLPGACPHVPLAEYEKLDGDGDPVLDENGDPVMEMAIGDVYDGMLVEVSGVYDGAAPGAQVKKAEEFARQGVLSGVNVQKLERQYRMHLPEKKQQFKAIELPQRGELNWIAYDEHGNMTASATASEYLARQKQKSGAKVMGSENTNAVNAELRERLKNAGVTGELSVLTDDLLTRVLDTVDRRDEKIEALQKDADLGIEYKKGLVDEALAAGVRAQGEHFAKNTYEGILNGLTIEQIRTMRDDWTRDGDKRLAGSGTNPGGRQTAEGDDPLEVAASGATNGAGSSDRAFRG